MWVRTAFREIAMHTRVILLIAITALLAACASGMGPTKDSDWRAQVGAALSPADGPLAFSSAAEWYPDTQGFQKEGTVTGNLAMR